MKNKLLLCIFILFTIFSYSQQENESTTLENTTNEITFKKVNVLDSKEGNIPLVGNKTHKENSKTSSQKNLSSGIGETPGMLSVSLTGSANYNVPIAVPPGINNVTPKISLSYDSQSGNGIAGYGWNINGISMISRIPSSKFHDNVIDGVDFDNLDRFALDGIRLVLKSGTYGTDGAEYETENYSNLKIVSYGVSPLGATYGPSHFIVQYPDGSKAHYGNSTDSRTHIGYAITYWENPQGIRIDYEYLNSNNGQSISKIKYGHANSATPINEIEFVYNYFGRKRREQSYVHNVSLNRNDLLEKINVHGHGNLLRVYSLTHDTDVIYRAGYQRLKSIRESTANISEHHSPINFNYENTDSSINYNDIVTDLGLVNIEQRNAQAVSLDFTGNGKLDFLVYPKDDKTKFWLFKDIQNGEQNSPWELNTGKFETMFPITWLDYQSKVGSGQGITLVKNGFSGQVRFEVYSNGTTSPTSHQYTKTWNAPSYTYDNNCSSSEQKNIPREYISGDFNGDGLTDVLAIGKSYTIRSCHEEDCSGGSDGDVGLIDPSGGIIGNDTCCSCNTNSISNKEVHFIDLNRNITFNFASSSGHLQQVLSDEDQLHTGDFNGDGKTDLLHVADGKLFIYSLDDNNSLSLLWQVNDIGIDINDPLLIGDYNGDGKTDFLDPVSNNSKSFRTFISTGTMFTVETRTHGFRYVKTNFNGNNGVLSGFNLVPLDVDSDGKTDIIEYNTVTSNNSTEGTQTITVYNNYGMSTSYPLPTQFRFINTGTATKTGNLKHFPIPIFLTSNQPNKNLDFASISNQWVTSFSFTRDHREDMLLRSIDNNGVKYTIGYDYLDSSSGSNIYSALNNNSYPFVDVKTAPGTKVVTKLERISSNTETLMKSFAYQGGVYNVEGLGFLGFQGIARSNWHTDSSDRIFSISKHDPSLRNATIAAYSQANYYGFTIPSSNYISKTTYQYTSSLSSNKVFKLSITSVLTQNNLDGTYGNTSYQYDSYNNPTHISTNYIGGSTFKSITYANNTGSNYYIGRPENIESTSTINSETFNSEEQFTYTGYLLTEKKTRGNGTPYDVENYEYDMYGNITKSIITPYGESSREKRYEYDSSGRFLTKSIDIEGLSTMYEYNTAVGTVEKIINPFEQEIIYDYDEWYRPIKVTDYLGKQASTTYTEASNYSYTISNISDDGSESEVFYDPLKRVTKVRGKDILGQWINKSYIYDKFDRVSKESEPYIGENPSQWNEIMYDFYGRSITQTLHTGRVISISYNGTSVTVDDGVKTVTTTNDGMGNRLSVTDPGGTINYTYYGNGSLKSADTGGSVVSVEQDGWGRKTKLTDPSAGIFEYAYNGYGELIREDTPKGSTSYTYSPIGKLTQKHITGDHTDMLVEHSYNSTNTFLSQTSVTSTDGNNSIYGYTYDNHQRLTNTSEINQYANFSKAYTYDDFGRVDKEEYEAKLLANNKTSTKEVQYNYQNGGVKNIIDVNTSETIWNVTGVNARGQLTSTLVGNDILQSNVYDNYGLLTSKNVSKNNGSTSQILMSLSTSFDTQRGTLNSRSNSLFSWSETFEYDNLDRLITFNDNNDNHTLSYDEKGRITNNSSVGDYNYSGTSYQVANIDLNNQGDLYYQQNELQQITYNAFKKPFEINEVGKEKIGFQYNAFMGRSHMFYGGTENDLNQRNNQKHYSFDTSMEISYDTSTDTTLFVTYIAGDAYSTSIIWRSEQQSFSASEDYYYLHRDYLGSIILITDADGNAKEKRHFDAWGNIVKLTDGNDIALDKLTFLDRGYTGHEHLQGVKLVHMNGRLYDPKLKRFLSPDNYIQNASNTQNFNRYSYVLNNPLMYIDPSGETGEEPGIGSGSSIGGIVGTLRNTFEGTDFGGVRNWFTKNIFRPIQDSTIGSWIKGLFKGKKSAPVEINNYTDLNNDPLAGTTSGNSLSLYDGSGANGERNIALFNEARVFGEAITYEYKLLDDEKNIHKITLTGWTYSYYQMYNIRKRTGSGREQVIEILIQSSEGNPRIVSSTLSGGMYSPGIDSSCGHYHLLPNRKFESIENFKSNLTDYVTEPLLEALRENPNYNPWNGSLTAGHISGGIGVGSGIITGYTGGRVNPIFSLLGKTGGRWFYGAAGGLFLGNIYRNNADHTDRTIKTNFRTGEHSW
jgi:RHS repeat-associated protein